MGIGKVTSLVLFSIILFPNSPYAIQVYMEVHHVGWLGIVSWLNNLWNKHLLPNPYRQIFMVCFVQLESLHKGLLGIAKTHHLMFILWL